jgi:hypothetical protein
MLPSSMWGNGIELVRAEIALMKEELAASRYGSQLVHVFDG